MIDEVVVNRWIQRYLNTNFKALKDDEITCLRSLSGLL